ncbi:MAG: hypothetical protein WCD07_08985 [Burkholderiales bacterium]
MVYIAAETFISDHMENNLINDSISVMPVTRKLPPQLLPRYRLGNRELAKNVYSLTPPGAGQHFIMAGLESTRGHLSKAVPYIFQRFGGRPVSGIF